MTIDLNLIPRDHPCAVWCQTSEEAERFLAAMRKSYPEKCRTWNNGTQWTEEYSCYNPDFFGGGRMFYDRHAYYTREGYEIVQFSEICTSEELQESNQPIELLFGLEG